MFSPVEVRGEYGAINSVTGTGLSGVHGEYGGAINGVTGAGPSGVSGEYSGAINGVTGAGPSGVRGEYNACQTRPHFTILEDAGLWTLYS
jgi:hypothetical protein